MGVGAGFCMYDVIVKKFTFTISSLDEFLFYFFLPTDTTAMYMCLWYEYGCAYKKLQASFQRTVAAWLSGSMLVSIIEVILHWAQLVLWWVGKPVAKSLNW